MRHVRLIAMLGLVVLLGSAFGCSPSDINSSSSGVPLGGGGAGTPASVRVTFGAATTTTIVNGGSTSVSATVRDGLGTAMPNVTVTFTVISAVAGSFSSSSAATNASGVATTTFTAASPAGDDSVATIGANVTVGASTINGTAQLTIGVPPRIPSSVIVSLGSSTISNGGNTTVTATVSDAVGPIQGVTVTFSVNPASAGSCSVAALTDVSGKTTVTFTAASPDSVVTINATAGVVTNGATLTIGSPPPPTPTSMTLSINPLSIGIQSQAVVSVTLHDASGNPAFNDVVTFLITGGTGTGSFSLFPTITSSVIATTNASGVATATFYSGTTSGSITIQAQSALGGLTKSTSILITSDPASISIGVPVGASSTLTNGQTVSIEATVLNVVGKPVTDGTVVNFAITSLPPNAGTLSATAASTIGGVARVTFTADPALTGGVIIQATVGALTPAQLIIIVNPALAGSLQFISATPAVINILGGSVTDSTVIFKVLNQVGSPMANQPVNFTLFGPFGATLDVGGTTSSSSTDSKGLVTTFLHAGDVAGPVRIVATTIVDPGPPAVTLTASSGAISIGGGLPSMRFFSTAVSKHNIDGLNCDGVTDTISVRLADRFGNYNIVKGTSVSFATSYGALDTSNVTDDSGATGSVWRSQTPRPADGFVPILVQTTGEENFVDTNGNGAYDVGVDTFTGADDLPEPFIDNNGDGTREGGELFFDWPSYVPSVSPNAVNPNGIYDQGPGPFFGNGVWDAKIPIFRNVQIWMTGPPKTGPALSHITCCNPAVNPACIPGDAAEVTTPITIPLGTGTQCYVYAADQNGNALISGTKVSLQSQFPSLPLITLSSGFDTFVDHPLVPGVPTPEITGFLVQNNAATPPVSLNLTATINWPGTCGTLKVTFPYPSTVTLGP